MSEAEIPTGPQRGRLLDLSSGYLPVGVAIAALVGALLIGFRVEGIVRGYTAELSAKVEALSASMTELRVQMATQTSAYAKQEELARVERELTAKIHELDRRIGP